MKSTHSPKRLATGLVFIAIGLILILNNTGMLPHLISDVLLSWPMIFVAIGIISLANRDFTTATIMFILGAVFLLPRVIEFPENFWSDYWPLVFVVMGLSILLKRKNPTKLSYTETKGSSENFFENTNVFSDANNSFADKEFTGAQISTVFGSTTLDLTSAKPISNKVTIHVTCIFGGVKLFVPKEWNISNNLVTILSGVSEKPYPTSFTPQDILLVINGKVLFSGVEIVRV